MTLTVFQIRRSNDSLSSFPRLVPHAPRPCQDGIITGTVPISISVRGLSTQYTRGHRSNSFCAQDLTELVELRARQRTFDGAYSRTAMSTLGFAITVIRLFDRRFFHSKLPFAFSTVREPQISYSWSHIYNFVRLSVLSELSATSPLAA